MVFKGFSGSDVGQHRAGLDGQSDGTGEVVVLAVALVLQVQGLLERPLFSRQRHSAQEGVLEHVVVVDLTHKEKN